MTSLDLLYTWKSLCYHFDKILGDESDSHLKAKHIILLKFNFFSLCYLGKHGTNTEWCPSKKTMISNSVFFLRGEV